MLLGISEAGNWPGAVKSNAEWFPVKERAVAQGIFNAGASLGSVIAPPLIALLYVGFGWKVTFVLIGLMGLLWIVPWLIIYKKLPGAHPWITEEERAHIREGIIETPGDASANEEVLSLRQLLSHRASWSVIVSRFFLEPIWWLFVGWMPIYLQNTYGFDVKQIGLFAWVPYVGAALGSIAGGWYAGRLITRKNSVDIGRKRTINIAGIIMFSGCWLPFFWQIPR